MRLVVVALVVILVVAGCSSQPGTKSLAPGKIENIEKVIFMGKGSYAILVPQDNGELKTLFLDNVKHEVHVFPDAPKDKKPWVDVQPTGREGKTFNLHIHNADEIMAK